MRPELWVLLIAGFFAVNAYYDNKYLKILKSWKKYYQIGFYIFLGVSLYIFIKRNPLDTKNLLTHANGFIKYMPIDKNSADILSPILRMSSQYSNSNPDSNSNTAQYNRMLNSGKNTKNGGATKRCVSETKKKFIAANQNWKCAKCNNQLQAWYEIDHKVRLENGGDNHINNLVALCRNCHGEKTAHENM